MGVNIDQTTICVNVHVDCVAFLKWQNTSDMSDGDKKNTNENTYLIDRIDNIFICSFMFLIGWM